MRGYRTWVWLGNMEQCLEVGRETILPMCCSIPSWAPQRINHSALPQTPSSGSVPAKHSDRQVHADPEVGLVFLVEPPSISPNHQPHPLQDLSVSSFSLAPGSRTTELGLLARLQTSGTLQGLSSISSQCSKGRHASH